METFRSFTSLRSTLEQAPKSSQYILRCCESAYSGLSVHAILFLIHIQVVQDTRDPGLRPIGPMSLDVYDAM